MASVTAVQDERRDAVPRVMQYMSCVVEDYTSILQLTSKKISGYFYYI